MGLKVGERDVGADSDVANEIEARRFGNLLELVLAVLGRFSL